MSSPLTAPDTSAAPAPVSDAARRPVGTGGVSGLLPFTWRLTRARFAARQGEGLLYGASVLAATVCSAIAFTVAGGTWMFHMRSVHPTGLLAELSADRTFAMILLFYVGLAVFACALVVPSLITLSVAGAQLGARGRERRLAALRLLGLSSGDVTRMALLDALLQNTVGVVLGWIVALLTRPLWAGLSFQAVQIDPQEMVMPVWLNLLIAVVLVLVGVGAAGWGLRQVRISPLGVSRRSSRPMVKAWRAAAFVVVVIAAVAAGGFFRLGGGVMALFTLAGVVAVLIAAINLVGPWVLQTVARLCAFAPVPAVRTAARRVVADPRATWNRTSTLGVLAFIGGFLTLMPFSYDPDTAASAAQATFMEHSRMDFTTGAIITLGAGFVLTATALLITQASATIERAEQTRALHRMGSPTGFALRVMWLETFAPLVASTALGAVVGMLMAAPMHNQVVRAGMPADSSPEVMVSVLVVGLVVAALALLATHPLHHALLGVQERRND